MSSTVARLVPGTAGRAAVLTERRTRNRHGAHVFTFFWSLRINHVFLRIIAVPVLAPLPDIAVHVVKTPGVCWETAYRRGLLSRKYAFLPLP